VCCLRRVSNEIAVHVIDVDVNPEPAWADYSTPTPASVSIHLGHVGGTAELRLNPDEAAPHGPQAICFTPGGVPIWGYTHGATRAEGIKLDFERLAQCLAEECRDPDRFNRHYFDALTVAVCIDFLCRVFKNVIGRHRAHGCVSTARSVGAPSIILADR
jgi:hypothetical protein